MLGAPSFTMCLLLFAGSGSQADGSILGSCYPAALRPVLLSCRQKAVCSLLLPVQVMADLLSAFGLG